MDLRPLLVVSGSYRANTVRMSLAVQREISNLHCAKELGPLQDQIGRVKLSVYERYVRGHTIEEDLKQLVDLLPRQMCKQFRHLS
jgi:hypothetical protein